MLFTVKYYAEEIHPDKFKGKGLRGRWIVFLNWIRCAIEKAVHRHVCAFLTDNPAISDSKVKSMFKQLDLDMKQDALEMERRSPLTESVLEQPEAPQALPRAIRYALPKVQRALEDVVEQETGVPQRPKKMDNLIGKYAFDTRAKRYANGRSFTVGDPDGDFEPLDKQDAG